VIAVCNSSFDVFISKGDVVRKLKNEKADKAKIDAEVALLLSLKKQLTIAEGTTGTQPANKQPASATATQPTGKVTSNKARKGQQKAQ